MTVGVPKESFAGERRVALVPAHVSTLTSAGCTVQVEAGAGEAAGYRDAAYRERGAEIVEDRQKLLADADLLLTVRCADADPDATQGYVEKLRKGAVVIGQADPYQDGAGLHALEAHGATLFALELMPRITRAQSMDVLSSMANLSGYKAVLLAADHLPKMLPMMMTAAGTIVPASVFVVGVGVAGLQAIATAKRLGAVVSAYDIRPSVKEQVHSLGAKFVEMELENEAAEGAGGYAKAMDEEFYRRQRELMSDVVAEHDVVITTAAVPGKQAPVLVTRDMVERMEPGSVIVDLAAERGGNCELSEPDQRVEHAGVRVLGPTNVPSTLAYHASQLYSKNITAFASVLLQEGKLHIDEADEIVSATMLLRDGERPRRESEGTGQQGTGQQGTSQEGS